METSIQKIYRFVGLFLVGIFGIGVAQASLPQIDSNFQSYDTEYFSFQFKNDHSVKRFEDIWYVQQNSKKQTSFVLFKRNGKVFHEPAFDCGRFFEQTEYCHSKIGIGDVVKNLKIKNRSEALRPFSAQGRQAFDFFSRQNISFDKMKDFQMVSRGEALKFILNWNNPGKKYSEHADNCFVDIDTSHPYSGVICYAKKQGIIKGIDGNFYPDLGINLWGTLQILYRNFKIPIKEFNDWERVDPMVLSGINKYHLALPIVASAYNDGILRSEASRSLWPNKVLMQSEFLDILYRFWRTKNGADLRSFDLGSYHSSPVVTSENLQVSYNAKSYKKNKVPNLSGLFPQKIRWIQTEFNRLIVYREVSKGVFQYMCSFPLNKPVKNVKLWWEAQKFTGKVRVDSKNGDFRWYKVSPNKELLKQLPFQDNSDALQFLARRDWLPNKVDAIKNPTIPVIKIFLEPSQWQEMLENRTTRERYVGWMNFEIDKTSVTERSIRIKTRGNGSLGYIKPSFTVETFKDLPENFPIGFLSDGNEFKLRSVMSDETMIREKLWYDVFQSLGLFAPDFKTVLVEINGQSFGLYQLVEPIKKDFFLRRNISTKDYFYAKNSGSAYNPNLTWLKDSAKTLSQYRVKGDGVKFIEFIQQLANLKSDISAKIDMNLVLDYAWLTYFLNGWDSVSRNYYVYLDAQKNQWGMFPWDGDESFQTSKLVIDMDKFVFYLRDTTGNFNQLFLYVSHFASPEQMRARGERILKHLQTDWVSTRIHYYQNRLGKYLEYDNSLWNGKALERRKSVYDTKKAIENLKKLWR